MTPIRDTMEHWERVLTSVAVAFAVAASVLRHAHRSAARRRLRRQAGGYY